MSLALALHRWLSSGVPWWGNVTWTPALSELLLRWTLLTTLSRNQVSIFGSKVGQICLKWDKSVTITISDQISFHFGSQRDVITKTNYSSFFMYKSEVLNFHKNSLRQSAAQVLLDFTICLFVCLSGIACVNVFIYLLYYDFLISN